MFSGILVAGLIAGAGSLPDARAGNDTQVAAPVAGIEAASEAPQPEVEAPRAALAARSSTTIRFPYVPETEWLPTQTNYFEGRDGGSAQYIVIHYTEITYQQTLRAFWRLESDVSAHYVIRGDGHIAQIVGEADVAWHSGNYFFNQNSIGIEFELNTLTNPFFTKAQYFAGAALACAIAGRHGIPLDREHVIGHNEVPGADHTDPGPTWDWPYFMWMTSICAPANESTVRASFVSETPYPVIPTNETGVVSIVLRNTGATAWRKDSPQEARLGIPNNARDLAFLGDGWLAPDRPAVQAEDVVPPGQTATFTFAVKGKLPGTYVLPLRGVVDGAAWMNDLGLFTVITVH
jgi:N-acetyl-anhydromuramyl-L-alanine amidase AmpD